MFYHVTLAFDKHKNVHDKLDKLSSLSIYPTEQDVQLAL